MNSARPAQDQQCPEPKRGLTFAEQPMCLAIPGRVLERREENGSLIGRIKFGGIVRQACLDFVPEAQVGDYVMVHVGFAISRVDAQEAQKTYELLEEMGRLEEELPPPEPLTHG